MTADVEAALAGHVRRPDRHHRRHRRVPAGELPGVGDRRGSASPRSAWARAHADRRRPAHLVLADGAHRLRCRSPPRWSPRCYVLRLGEAPLTTMTLLGLAAVTALVVDDVVGDVAAIRARARERRAAGRVGRRGADRRRRGRPAQPAGLRDRHRAPRARPAAVPARTGRRLRPARAADLRPRGAGLVRRGARGHPGPRRPARPPRARGSDRAAPFSGWVRRGYDRAAGAHGRPHRARRPRPRRPRARSCWPGCPRWARVRCCPASRTATSSSGSRRPRARRWPRWTASPASPPPSCAELPGVDVGRHARRPGRRRRRGGRRGCQRDLAHRRRRRRLRRDARRRPVGGPWLPGPAQRRSAPTPTTG